MGLFLNVLFPFCLLWLSDFILFFFISFLSLDFSLLLCGAVFHYARAFNSDISTWQVGKVTAMFESKRSKTMFLCGDPV